MKLLNATVRNLSRIMFVLGLILAVGHPRTPILVPACITMAMSVFLIILIGNPYADRKSIT